MVKIEWLESSFACSDEINKVEHWISERATDLQDVCMAIKRLQEVLKNEIYFGIVIPNTECFWSVEISESNGIFDIALLCEGIHVALVLLENLPCFTKQDYQELESKIIEFVRKKGSATFREIAEGVRYG